MRREAKNAYGQNGQTDKMPTVYNKAGWNLIKINEAG